jgi:hypothetical protein
MVTWYRLLDNARSPFEVVAVARDYLATWSPEELSSLPTNVRPGKLRDERDIEELHSLLVETFRDSKASGPALAALQRLTSVMVRATIRISELSDASPGSEPAGDSKGPRNASSRRDH